MRDVILCILLIILVAIFLKNAIQATRLLLKTRKGEVRFKCEKTGLDVEVFEYTTLGMDCQSSSSKLEDAQIRILEVRLTVMGSIAQKNFDRGPEDYVLSIGNFQHLIKGVMSQPTYYDDKTVITIFLSRPIEQVQGKK